MAKILICEDIESSAKRLVEEADKDDHKTLVLAKNLDRDYIIDNIEKVVLEEQPNYMIIDGLNSRCFEAIELARKASPNLIAILYTSSKDLVEKAKEKGIPAFCKKSSQELDNMFWYIIENKKNR